MIERKSAMQALRSISLGIAILSAASACSTPLPRASSGQPAPSAGRGANQPQSPRQPAGARSQTDVDREMRQRGYKPASYRGERVYCRNELLTGSNLASKVCLTVQQIEDQERSGKEILNVNRPAGCTPTKGVCN
jgi:hypothetical protein